MNSCAWFVKRPTIKNGTPMPSVYANSRKNASLGFTVANAKIAPKAALTHGVHPTAKAAPNKKAVAYFDLNLVRTANL